MGYRKDWADGAGEGLERLVFDEWYPLSTTVGKSWVKLGFLAMAGSGGLWAPEFGLHKDGLSVNGMTPLTPG
ncbi:hypothetical protein, partial [Luteolibacter marinus]|uniref:hypothetical protein n=1 Tax=Luteolibacter marinus TaxID=2776705 RepID=UPI001D0024E6